MSLIDWIPGLNQLTEYIGLGIDNMSSDNLANARAIYRKNHPNAPTQIPNKDLINDIRKNPQLYTDDIVSDIADVKLDDGIIFNPKDKFMKVNDATMIAGTKAGDNGKLAKSIMSMYGGGPGTANSNVAASVNVGDMKLGGTIDVKINGESTQESREVGKNLMSDPLFLRELSLKINEAANKALKGKTS
jgi:hypothetical protein